jgi:hypothetical protein
MASGEVEERKLRAWPYRRRDVCSGQNGDRGNPQVRVSVCGAEHADEPAALERGKIDGVDHGRAAAVAGRSNR